MNRSSLLYRELTSEELEAVFASALPGERILEYGLLSGGLFNTTYRVKSEAHDTVLRMGPVNRELLLPFEHGLMGAEACVDGLCHGAGIPASRVLCCDTSKSVLDRDFMVVEYIESIPLSSDRVPKDAVPELHRECGMLAKKLHGITGETFGRVSQVLSGNGKATWAKAVEFEFQCLLDTGLDRGVFSPELAKRTAEAVEKTAPILNRVKTPGLAHADLWAGNVLVGQDGDGWHVRAVIDGDRAFWGDTDFDLVTPWMITLDFLAGYGERKCGFTPEEQKQKNSLMRALLALTDAYVWKIEYAEPEEYEKNLAHGERLIREL